MTRREFLAATAAVVPAVLAACGGSPSGPAPATPAGSAKTAGAKLPSQIAFEGPKPDLPATADGVAPAFLSYPKNLVKSVSAAPGKGGTVTTATTTSQAVPPALEQNAAWQAINKALNVDLKLPIISTTDYQSKMAAVLAAGDLPDMIRVSNIGDTLPNVPTLLKNACQDLTPFLAGDAIKDYPNLANFPAYPWPNAVFNGAIYCVPSPGNYDGYGWFVNQNLLDSIGVTQFKNRDEMTAAIKSLFVPGQRYAFGSATGGVRSTFYYSLQLHGAPNNWRQTNGKFVKDVETDEFKEAASYFRSLWDAGYVHPDAPTMNINTASSAWYSGKTIFHWQGLGVFSGTAQRQIGVQADAKPRILLPFSWDGRAKATHFLGPGFGGLTAFKKATSDRIKELLGILNYLAAPFGTQEQLLVKYGVADVDYKLDASGNPVPTTQGQTDLNAPWWALVGPPPVMYDPAAPDLIEVLYDAETKILPLGVKDASAGLYSQTDADTKVKLGQMIVDGFNAVIFGRAPVSSLDQVAKDWRAAGGDQARAEFEQAYADANK
ncbi:MAG: extracellular solute-binding protein [Chloroflexi bacterium]|nr:extracellular solute-binding protein [Chloroflexota bacterium]